LYWNAAVNPDRAVSTIDAGHLQGVAVNGGNRYIFHTGVIEKYDAAWNLQTNNQNVFAGLPTTFGPVQHVGDGDYFGGKLYVPMESDFGSNGKYIGVYDANSPGLPLVAVRDISAQHHEVSSIVVVPEHGAHGVMYVSSFFAGIGAEKLWMYDFQNGNSSAPEFGQFLGTLSIPSTITDIQGIEWKAPYFYFSASGQGGNQISRVALTDAGLAANSELVARGFRTVQGMAIDGDLAYQALQSGSTFEFVDVLKNLEVPVPEPSACTLAGVGSVLVLLLGRRRLSRQAR
jgi:hypothetical protein